MNRVLPIPLVRTLSELLQGWIEIAPAEDRRLTGLTLDSREVSPGNLFCALRGSCKHGLEYANQAVAQGAMAILAEADAEWPVTRRSGLAARLGVPVLVLPGLSSILSALAGRFYGEPGHHLDLIAVTGTNGKTSVVTWTAICLTTHWQEERVDQPVVEGTRDRNEPLRCAMVGTLGYGFPGALTNSGYTTPNAVHLQAILAQLREQGAGAVALEVSSHALDQGRAAGVPVDTAVFTNLTRDHLDYHRDLLDYAQTKRRLFHTPGLRQAVLNADDPFGLEILNSLDPTVGVILYSLAPDFIPPRSGLGWLRVEALEPQVRGMHLEVASSWGRGGATVAVLGRFNAANLLAVLGVLLVRGLDLETALQRLTRVPGIPGRMECFGQDAQPLVVVDYAHTPDALEQALGVLRTHHPSQLITLFGCGGERDRGKRPQMGAVAERLSDLVILTDDNPRNEDGAQIIQEILAGMRTPAAVQVERQRGRAIRQAIRAANSGDIVLVAGKGHEVTQCIGAVNHPFSDRAEVIRALDEVWNNREPPRLDGTCEDGALGTNSVCIEP